MVSLSHFFLFLDLLISFTVEAGCPLAAMTLEHFVLRGFYEAEKGVAGG